MSQHRYGPIDVLKEHRDRDMTPTDEIRNVLYDKGYRRGATYTPRGVMQPVTAFTAYTKAGQFLLLLEYADGGCEVLRPVCGINDIEATIAAIP